MASRYDDELWELVPEGRVPPFLKVLNGDVENAPDDTEQPAPIAPELDEPEPEPEAPKTI